MHKATWCTFRHQPEDFSYKKLLHFPRKSFFQISLISHGNCSAKYTLFDNNIIFDGDEYPSGLQDKVYPHT